LQSGENVWRIELATRMAALVDGAAFFRSVREAILKARWSVFISSWDLHSQTRLVGETGQAHDGGPEALAEFLSAVVKERPKLVVRLLLWDYSVLYANERELFPRLTLGCKTPERVKFALDDAVGYTRYRTFPSRWPLLGLDRIYCRPGTALIRSYIDGHARACSDHLPIIADVMPVQ